jgi:hypothetical protein
MNVAFPLRRGCIEIRVPEGAPLMGTLAVHKRWLAKRPSEYRAIDANQSKRRFVALIKATHEAQSDTAVSTLVQGQSHAVGPE